MWAEPGIYVAPRWHPVTRQPMWMLADANDRDLWHLGGPWVREEDAKARLYDLRPEPRHADSSL